MNDDAQQYSKIAAAIQYLQSTFRRQPDLEEIAAHVNMSPFHFQRIFTAWAGISPKKFLQYLTIEYAKEVLTASTVFETAIESGLSGTGRLHDLFVTIEGMTPGEYKNGGQDLLINYSFADTPFGQIITGSTSRGVCHLAFADDQQEALTVLKTKFPNATFSNTTDQFQDDILGAFGGDGKSNRPISLHLRGTNFQLKVWETLLKIPPGSLVTYGTIARQLQQPGASRAIGTAVGDNPIAYIIPCHRVIQSSGILGGYHWGPTRKAAIIGWEAAKKNLPAYDLG